MGDPESSGHFSLENVVLEPCNGLTPFKVSQLSSWQHDKNKFDPSQMLPYEATNMTTFHTQAQLLYVLCADFQFFLLYEQRVQIKAF